MAEQMELNDILNEKSAPKPEPQAPAVPPPVEVKDSVEKQQVERNRGLRDKHREREQDAQGRVRDPVTGQYAAKEPKTEEAAKPTEKAPEKPAEAPPAKAIAAPQQELTDKEKAFLRAAQEERGKRQELERRLAAIESAKAQPPASAEPAKTFWDDPEGALEKHKQEIRREQIQERLKTTELIARRAHPDFEEKLAVFATVVQQTPGLSQQWLASPDPAEFAYNLGKNHLELQQAGSIDELRAKIEKETRIKLETELKEKADKLAQERAAIPPSLSEARSTGVNKPVWGGIPSLEDVLKG